MKVKVPGSVGALGGLPLGLQVGAPLLDGPHGALQEVAAVTGADAVHEAGAVLVMALMIVPAAIAQLLSHSIHGMYIITVGITVACSVVGFWAAYVLDASTSSGLAFFYGIVYLAVVAVTVIGRRLRTPSTS